MGKDPGGEKSSPERQATPLRCCYKCTLTHPSPSDSGPPLVAVATNNFCIRASAGLLLSGSRAPGKPARSPKPFKNESRLAKLQHIHPPTPIASRALPARLTPARSGFPERRPRRPPPSGALLPRPAGAGWGRRPRAASRCSFPRRLCGCQIGAGEPSGPRGGPPAAVPETRAGGGGRPRRPHRPPGAEPEVAANKCKLLGPPGRLGEDPRSGTGQPPARVGFAAARRGAGAFPLPGARRGPDGRGASLPPCTPLQVNAEAKSSCHHSRSPSGLLSPGLIRAA